MLAVDKNVTVFERRTGGWAKYGVAPQRVDSMREAIYRLIQGEKFYFIVINEDTVPEFMPLLPIMRDVTEAPIFVLTSNYTVEKRTTALKNGADVYDPIHAQPRHNILSMLELLKRWSDRSLNLEVLVGGDIVLSQPRRKVFIKDNEIALSKTEFAILHYLMSNTGCVMTHEQILKAAWDEYIESDVGVLWRAVNRLRAKLPAPANEYIKIVRGVGYVFEP
jgi:DNA-binding response OmpR family regulator